ncbi:MAG TPA: hypothetical protein VHV78_11420 [Gemmatimonadaceae bacterium]|nr:hypothetical protein [Gemmatimonadaceae bacterium]
MAKHTATLSVVHDRADYYYVDTNTIGRNKRPVNFGAVRVGKNYVSYYLMPVCGKGLIDRLSPALKKRMQGKACFNFADVDDSIFAELDRLTGDCYGTWKAIGWVD